MFLKRFLSVIVLLVFCSAANAAESEKAIKSADGLVKEKKYLQAVELLRKDGLYKADTVLFAKYVELLTGYYTHAINFKLFAVRDLLPHERIEDVRGSSGSYTIVGGDLEEDLKEMEKKHPKDAHVRFAIGYYISSALSCGCAGGLTEYSPDLKTEYGYFKKAYDEKVYDGWSLFRMGMYNQQSNNIKLARKFYDSGIAEGFDNPSLHYNYAIIHLQAGGLAEALSHVDKAVKGYEGGRLLADSYNLKGIILEERGEMKAAREQYEKGLSVVSWHPGSFKSLAFMLKKAGSDSEYAALVKKYVALDYANSYLFNRYIELLEDSGISEVDMEIERHLSSLKGLGPEETGALYFNLGRMAEMRDKRDDAVMRYKRSLGAFGRMKTPPDGAVEALQARLSELEGS